MKCLTSQTSFRPTQEIFASIGRHDEYERQDALPLSGATFAAPDPNGRGRSSMRKLILQLQMSIDGFASGPNGELDWIFPGFAPDAMGWMVERLWQAGAHLMGRATYRGMAAHWPT